MRTGDRMTQNGILNKLVRINIKLGKPIFDFKNYS